MSFITLGMDKDLIKDLFEVNNWEWKDEKELQQRYNTPDHYAKFGAVIQYYIGMGTMVKKNLIKSDMVPTGIALLVRSFWKKYEPIAARLTDDPHAFDMIEYLYHEIKEMNP
jgi:hypothetical protein